MFKIDRHKLNIIIALLLVYVVWGSTYLAMAFAVQSFPSYFMTFLRNFFAALIMLALGFFIKEKSLTKKQKKIAMISGVFLVAANGTVAFVERWLPSGLAAVVVGCLPVWLMVLNWLSFSKIKPSLIKILGGVLGLIGIVLLASEEIHFNFSGWQSGLFIFLNVAILLWAIGSLVQKNLKQMQSLFYFTGLQLFSGSMIVFTISFIFEKPWLMDYTSLASRSVLSLLYLIIFGSVVAFTAFSWLTRNVEPHIVSTYALVNPVIAVLLGWLLGKEKITTNFISAFIFVSIGTFLLLYGDRWLKKNKIYATDLKDSW